MSAVDRAVVKAEMRDAWLLDNGCSFHITDDISLLENAEKIEPFDIECGHKLSLPAARKGRVTLPASTEVLDSLKQDNVVYVENAASNLISVGELVQPDVRVTFHDAQARVTRRSDG
eukprot:22207-Chlamydomonas_euryale.AAC.1